MRVRRNFAFIDLGGFTSYTETHGDQEAVWVLGLFRSHVREVGTRRGVRVAKWLGDGAMFVSVDEQPLIEAVIEVESRVDDGESPLVLRGGLAGGDVILMEGDDYIGRAVNLAARLGQEAQPHEIRCTPELANSAPPWVEVQPLDPVRLKGFRDPVAVVNLSYRDHATDTVGDPVCGMQLPADAVVATRVDAAGATVPFCSLSCAEIWDDSEAGKEGNPGWRR